MTIARTAKPALVRQRRRARSTLEGGAAAISPPAAGVDAAGDADTGDFRREVDRLRTIVVVLGMEGSGIALVSRTLQQLGVEMGEPLRATQSDGSAERPAIAVFHEEILEAMDRPRESLQHGLPLPAGWWRDRKIQAIKRRMHDYLKRELEATDRLWGFADPRTCRLLPLWWEVFDALGIHPHYVWSIRAPGESAAEMTEKAAVSDLLSRQQAEVRWLAYNYDALRYLLGTQPIIVEYRDLIRDLGSLNQRIMRRLGPTARIVDSTIVEGTVADTGIAGAAKDRGGMVAGIPLAESFFNEVAEASHSEAGANDERLGRYVAILDVVLSVIQPFLEAPKAAPGLFSEVRKSAFVQAKIAEIPGRLHAEPVRAEEFSKRLSLRENELAALVAENVAVHDKLKTIVTQAKELAARLEAATAENADLRGMLKAADVKAEKLALAAKARAARLLAQREDVSRRLRFLVAHKKALDTRLQANERERTEAQFERNREATEHSEALARLEAAIAAKQELNSQLEQALVKSEARCRELQNVCDELRTVCDGYVARIDELKKRRA